MAFLDFRKAFDTVWRDGLMHAVWKSGIRGRIWKLIDSLYDNVQAKVKFGDFETDFFNVEEGVKQGCSLSPVLFCVFINELSKMIKSHDIGVRIHDVCMGSLFWADDVVLLGNDEHELNRLLDIAAEFAQDYKLNFNYDKSNVLIVGQRTDKSKRWNLGDNVISEVDTYKYLGVQISRNLSDHNRVDEVIKKGNRLIAYVKSIIDNFDNFNRVHYGDILWRTIALPAINYASSVWVTGSKKDIDRIENLQLQMARHILKAPRNTPRVTLYGDLGWVPIATIQNSFRAKYFYRLLNLDEHRWPKLLFNTMMCLDLDPSALRFKFLSSIRSNLSKLDMDHVYHCAQTLSDQINPNWVHTIKYLNYKLFVNEWYNEACMKTSLVDYVSLKDSPSLESYLLDKTDFHAAALKFKLRSNTLPLERRFSKWDSDNDGTCKLCNDGIEDVVHFLFICNALRDIRIDEYKKLEESLMNNSGKDIWELFISGNIDIKIHLTLGSISCTFKDLKDNNFIYDIFDTFCKSYSKRAWKLRSEIKSI